MSQKNSRLIYIHDFPVSVYEADIAYSVGLPENYFERFLKVFDEVELLTRHVKVISVGDGLTKSENSFVSLSPLSTSDRYLSIFKQIFKNRSTLQDKPVVINYPSILGLFYLTIVRPTFYSLEHVNDDNIFESKPLGKLVTIFLKLVKSKHLSKAKGVLTVSPYLISDHYPTKRLVSSNVILTDSSFSSKVNRPNDSSLTICLVGAMSKKKGVDLAIEFVLNTSLNVQLYLAGPLNDVDLSLIETSDKVRYLGVLKKEEVKDLIKSSDIYIQPSRAEGLPRATIEAMALSKPAITSLHPCFKGLIDERLTVDFTDYFAVESAISHVLENYESLSMYNFRKAQNFRYEKLITDKKAFYKEVFYELPSN